MSAGRALEWALVVLVMIGALPMAIGAVQLLLVGLHPFRSHLDRVGPRYPRTAVLVPAWNEAAVLGVTIDRLLALDYPRDRLRLYVVDDASTDETPEVLTAKMAEHPGSVVHLRRERGGEGKAHTLNHGIDQVLADDWAEAVLIMDADVIFTPPSLRRLARHLADPAVGAVTAYIKEGSSHQNGVRRAVAFEYAVAQAGARRAQNVLGALACLAGGAQLHTRENLESIGGRIDTGTLAEDTVTTLLTQVGGRKVVFEPNAIVLAEEPDSFAALWKQRLRWARGNVQVTRRFRSVWFRRTSTHRLGGILFGLIWMTTLLLPVLMITSSAALVGLWIMRSDLALHAFRLLWVTNGLAFILLVVLTLLIDTSIARATWRRAIMFPGLVSVVIILASCFPAVFAWLSDIVEDATGWRFDHTGQRIIQLAIYLWVSLCMLAAYLVMRIDRAGAHLAANVAMWVVGYGPFLSAVTVTAYILEARGAEQVWDKTVKTGQLAGSS